MPAGEQYITTNQPEQTREEKEAALVESIDYYAGEGELYVGYVEMMQLELAALRNEPEAA